MEKEIIRKYIEEIINTGNVEKISEFIDDNYVEEYNEKRRQFRQGGNGKIVEHSGADNLLEPLLEIEAIKIIEK